jgi:hypothetical protein
VPKFSVRIIEVDRIIAGVNVEVQRLSFSDFPLGGSLLTQAVFRSCFDNGCPMFNSDEIRGTKDRWL